MLIFLFVKLDEPSVYVGTSQVISLPFLSSLLPVIFLFITCLYLGENKHLTYYNPCSYFLFDFIDAAVIGIKYKDMERKLFSKRDQKKFQNISE